jgi:hypothetical protein
MHAKRADHRRVAGLLLVLSVLAGGAVGCSSNRSGTPPTIEPARPAVSPPVTSAPAGVVHPLAGHPQAAIFDAGSSALVVLTPGADRQAPSTATVIGSAGGPPRTIALAGPATALTGDGRGKAYLSARGGYFVANLVAGTAAHIDVSGEQHTDFTAIAHRADGRLMLGTSDGAVFTLASDGTVAERTKIFARVDALVTQGNITVVLDRGQTSVTTIEPDGGAGQSLRAGQGATTLAADPDGRVLAADTRGGALLVYGVDPLILRQAHPVRYAPYGLAGSRGLAWVSQTATNTVIGYDLATGIPVEKVRYPTVQQPNSLAFDDASGTLYVVSASGAGVQMIEHAAPQ